MTSFHDVALLRLSANYRLTDADVIQCLTQFDRIDTNDLKCFNRYRLMLSKATQRRPRGPVMEYFRDHSIGIAFRGFWRTG